MMHRIHYVFREWALNVQLHRMLEVGFEQGINRFNLTDLSIMSKMSSGPIGERISSYVEEESRKQAASNDAVSDSIGGTGD